MVRFIHETFFFSFFSIDPLLAELYVAYTYMVYGLLC